LKGESFIKESEKVDYKKLATVLTITVFGEASICEEEERRWICSVFLNRLEQPYFFADDKTDDIRSIAEGFHAWTRPNVRILNTFDREKFLQISKEVHEEIEKWRYGSRHTDATFYITKEALKANAGKTGKQIFKSYFDLEEVLAPESFLHTFYRITDLEEV